MVKTPTFLIDATFLLKDAQEAYLGAAPIIGNIGGNNSVIYDAVRTMLKLRKSLGIINGAVLFGNSTARESSFVNIEKFRDCLRALGTHVVFETNRSVAALCRSILDDLTTFWIVSRDKAVLQLASANCGVILATEGAVPEVVNLEKLSSSFGIRPGQVPSFIALTEAGIGESLSPRQAVRLLELHENLYIIYENAATLTASPKIRRYLTENKLALLARLPDLTAEAGEPTVLRSCALVRNDLNSKRVFADYGFLSLCRLLEMPDRVALVSETNDRSSNYVAILDRAGWMELKKVITNSGCCAVDTESSDKDPRKATLFGIAFSVKENHAYYLPTTRTDLKGISTETVLKELHDLLARGVKVVGHNLKYDYVLLKRHGIQIVSTYFDTMLAARQCFGDWDLFNLGAVTKKLLGKEVTRFRDLVKKGSSLLDVPFNDLMEHGCIDADMTFRLHTKLRQTLRLRGMEGDFMENTMPLMRLLADKEVDGVRMDVSALTRKVHCIASELLSKRVSICMKAGKEFDLASFSEIATVFRGIDGIRERVGSLPLRRARLEELAQHYEIARELSEYMRMRKQLEQLESICRAEKGGKVFPLFSQMKSVHGSVSSSDPNIFDLPEPFSGGAVLDHEIRIHMADVGKSLDILQLLASDPWLERDRQMGSGSLVIGKEPVLTGIDHAEALLTIVIGLPNSSLCKRLLIDPRRADALRALITSRYSILFEWLDAYKLKVRSTGFSVSGERRRFWHGFDSSDIEKGNQAIRAAVRWLIKL